MNIGLGEIDLTLGGVLERLITLMRGLRLAKQRIGLVALLDGAGALLQQEIGALIFRLAELEVGGVEFDGALCGDEVLLSGGELSLLHFQRRHVDRDLLAVIGIVEPGDQRAGIYPLPLIERQLDDGRLHGLEAEHGLMRFDVAGNQDGRGEPRPGEPLLQGAALEIAGNGHRDQHDGDNQQRPFLPSLGRRFGFRSKGKRRMHRLASKIIAALHASCRCTLL